MLDRVSKIAAITASTVAIVVILIGGVAWAIRLDTNLDGVRGDVSQLQKDLAQVQSDIADLRRDMDEVRENQRLILRSLEALSVAVSNHTHDEDGRVQIPLRDR